MSSVLRVKVEPSVSTTLGTDQQPADRYAQPVSLITAQGTEICVVCHVDTGVPVREPVDTRPNYVAGIGQCCEGCGSHW